MARVRFEIHCNDCPLKGYVKNPNDAWFIVLVNTAWVGKCYKFVCPKCGHEHQRTIDEAGNMVAWTDGDRRFVGARADSKPEVDVSRSFKQGSGKAADWATADRIIVPLSSWSEKPRLELLKVVPCGFMSDAWIRKAAEEKGIPSEENDDGA